MNNAVKAIERNAALKQLNGKADLPGVFTDAVGRQQAAERNSVSGLARQLGITSDEYEAAKEEVEQQLFDSIELDENDFRAKKQEPEYTISDTVFDREEATETCKQDLNFFASIAAPHIFTFMFPPEFISIWKLLVDGAHERLVDPVLGRVKKFPQISLGIPRGHAKTTLVKFFVLYCILFTDKKFILVSSATASLAQNVTSDIADMLDEPNIKHLFGDWRLGIEKDTQELKKFGFRGRNIIIAAVGAGGSLRGLNIKNVRPDVIIFEDIQTRECADSQLQSELLERWMYGTAMKAKSPHGCLFLFVGNMYPTNYSILKKLKTNHTWIKFICGAILADNTALWEELRSLQELLDELDTDIAAGHPEIFFSEVLNDTEAGQNTRIDFSSFAPWPYEEDEIPQGRFILIDPSTGKGLDPDVIGYFEVFDEKPCFRELIQGFFSPGVLIKKALAMALSTNTRLIVCDATSYQFTLLYWFEQVCSSLGIEGLYFMPIYQTKTSKNSRIAAGLKSLESAEIILHDSVRPMVQNQIANWNPMKRENVDDILDVISNCKKVVVDYGYLASSENQLYLLEGQVSGVVENNSLF